MLNLTKHPVTPKAKTTADSEAASCHGVHTYRSISTKPENNENVMLERNPLKAQLVDQRPDTCSRTIGSPLQLSRSLVKTKPDRFINKVSECLSHLLRPSVDDITESKKSINGPIQSPPSIRKALWDVSCLSPQNCCH